VLKVSFVDQETQHEPEALRHWDGDGDGDGAVRRPVSTNDRAGLRAARRRGG
jgi:hypothetical protein